MSQSSGLSLLDPFDLVRFGFFVGVVLGDGAVGRSRAMWGRAFFFGVGFSFDRFSSLEFGRGKLLLEL